MSLSETRLAEIRARATWTCRERGADIDALLAEVDRLRAGIEALAATGEADGRGNSRDLARHLRALLNPPTEGETDGTA